MNPAAAFQDTYADSAYFRIVVWTAVVITGAVAIQWILDFGPKQAAVAPPPIATGPGSYASPFGAWTAPAPVTGTLPPLQPATAAAGAGATIVVKPYIPPPPSLKPIARPELADVAPAERPGGMSPRPRPELEGVQIDVSKSGGALQPIEHPELRQLQETE